MSSRIPFLIVLLSTLAQGARAVDHVVLQRDGQRVRIAGRVLVEAQDDGLLLLAPDGVLWAVQPDELVERKADAAPFVPLSREKLVESVLDELPDGFQTYQTAHYVICYNTSKAYAQWCGALYERLYRAMVNYWDRRGLDLKEPEVPLIALVFDDEASYADYARAELGDAVDSIIGYYSLRSNRIIMYDLTGIESLAVGRRPVAVSQVQQILSRPDASRTVATIIHEATHQLAFNLGLHRRYADIPLWTSEGIAIYFETPDLGSTKGWRTVGAVNAPRLARFRDYLRRRPADSLTTLIATDDRFRQADQVADAYAEAWAFTFYLVRQYPRQYVAYLELLGEKGPLLYDEPAARLRQFEQCFGKTPQQLDADFRRQTLRLRSP